VEIEKTRGTLSWIAVFALREGSLKPGMRGYLNAVWGNSVERSKDSYYKPGGVGKIKKR